VRDEQLELVLAQRLARRPAIELLELLHLAVEVEAEVLLDPEDVAHQGVARLVGLLPVLHPEEAEEGQHEEADGDARRVPEPVRSGALGGLAGGREEGGHAAVDIVPGGAHRAQPGPAPARPRRPRRSL